MSIARITEYIKGRWPWMRLFWSSMVVDYGGTRKVLLRGMFSDSWLWCHFNNKGYAHEDFTRDSLENIIERTQFAREMDMICANLRAMMQNPRKADSEEFPYISRYFRLGLCTCECGELRWTNPALGEFAARKDKYVDALEDYLRVETLKTAVNVLLPQPIAEEINSVIKSG